jgi:dTDP-4-amino-4,6-dideoxygalactose transaminase
MKIEVYSPTIRRKEMDAVLTAMVEEKIGPGERNRLLIQCAKEHLRFDYALALRSPAVALHFALKALNVKNGQAVIISALSPRFYLQVIEDLQLVPLFCDVSFDFPCISREMIEKTIANKNTDLEICAIVMHHTLGFTPDISSINELGVPVIEDISQSFGNNLQIAEKNENKDKVNGVFSILGLEERDMLTSGGGALLFAMNRRDGSVLKNYSGLADEYCLPDINAALAIVQFREIQRNISKRRDISGNYTHASLRTRHKRFIPLSEDEYNCYSFSLILETGLKDVIAYARKKDIAVESAMENAVANTGLCENCPVSNSLVLRTVLFPLYPRLRPQDVERVSRLITTLP